MEINEFIKRDGKMLAKKDFTFIETSDGPLWYYNLQKDIPVDRIISFNFYQLRGQYFKTYPAAIATFNSAAMKQGDYNFEDAPRNDFDADPEKGLGETEIWLNSEPEDSWYCYTIFYSTI